MNRGAVNYRELPIAERIELVGDIRDSIAEETAPIVLSDDDRAELLRRLAAHEADPASAVPWEQIRAGLLKSPR